MMPTNDILTEHEIAINSAERRVFHLLHSLEWQLHCEKKSGCIWRMRCNITENNMFRFEGIIHNRTPAEVAVMIHPEGLHRAKWDSQSAGTSLLQEVDPETSIILHETKSRMMGLVAPRETVDLCRFSTDPEDGTRTVVMVSVSHEKAPLRAGTVRAHTHPTLLVISPLGTSDTKITSILHAELHLFGVPTSVVESLIPKGIHTFFDDLNKYASKTRNEGLSAASTHWMVLNFF
ncbi:unnamed protein product [Caenorhabditis auriculariae]|uniref:START domain-containing protein n=1 Tax=Caenorhabditis auriculariae TaxID=2777116 RepID=A0A8S1GRB4_9PELO|nr:unnamed protein product [Caenorhabditis auriculariae]